LIVLASQKKACFQDDICQLFEVLLDSEPAEGLGNILQFLLVRFIVIDKLVDFFHFGLIL
jgi:hypothetical protein